MKNFEYYFSFCMGYLDKIGLLIVKQLFIFIEYKGPINR